jgi:hypothetical protein
MRSDSALLPWTVAVLPAVAPVAYWSEATRTDGAPQEYRAPASWCACCFPVRRSWCRGTSIVLRRQALNRLRLDCLAPLTRLSSPRGNERTITLLRRRGSLSSPLRRASGRTRIWRAVESTKHDEGGASAWLVHGRRGGALGKFVNVGASRSVHNLRGWALGGRGKVFAVFCGAESRASGDAAARKW